MLSNIEKTIIAIAVQKDLSANYEERQKIWKWANELLKNFDTNKYECKR